MGKDIQQVNGNSKNNHNNLNLNEILKNTSLSKNLNNFSKISSQFVNTSLYTELQRQNMIHGKMLKNNYINIIDTSNIKNTALLYNKNLFNHNNTNIFNIPKNFYKNNIPKNSINIDSKIIKQLNIPKLKFETQKIINSNIFENTIKTLHKIDIKKIIEELDLINKSKIPICLEYDIYLPLQILKEIPITSEFNSQEEADDYLSHLLEYLESINFTVYDSIPETEETKNEVAQIKTLYEFNYKKLIILFCFERIEHCMHQLRFSYTTKTIKNRTTQMKSVQEYMKILTETTNDDLKEILNQILKLKEKDPKKYLKFNIYRDFSEDPLVATSIDNGYIPLNRNLFMNGHVEDEKITDLLVKKAILAYGFFLTLNQLRIEKGNL